MIAMAQPVDAVDLFAGPGGWDVAAEALGIRTLGFEYDAAACRTRRANGHWTIEGDLTKLDPRDHLTRGQIASPPCQGFSASGKGRGRADSVLLLERLAEVRTRTDLEREIEFLADHMTDERTLLVLEPLRWLLTNLPSWAAWEQVPAVLPIWEACAVIMRRLGYSVETAILNAEQYGVPQTRRRAILVARAPWMVAELGPVQLPTPTHSRYHNRTPSKLDEGVAPWVSMAQALEFGATERPAMTVTGGGATTGGAEPFGNEARKGLARERDAGRWAQRSNYSSGSSDGRTAAERGRTIRDQDEPSTTLTGKGFQWQEARPATTVQCDPRIWPPGHKINADDLRRDPDAAEKYGDRKGTEAVRVTAEEAAALQTFPRGYKWEGTKTQVFQQIGNAIPPLLAKAVLCSVVGLPFDPSRTAS